MSNRLTNRVSFRKFSMKSLRDTLEGQEPPYPVYYFGRIVKSERPESAGSLYRNVRQNPLPELPESSVSLGSQDYRESEEDEYISTE